MPEGLSVGGTATFNAGAGPITLTTPTNNLVGAVSLNNSGANNVAVTDANAIVIGTSSVGTGTLAVISDGTILQTGPITQAPGAGAASFTATANALISLTQANDFTGAVSASNIGGSDILITDASALKLGTVSPGSGDLTLVANGAITQTGPLTVGGKTSVAAGAANDITLNHAANVFSGQVRIVSGNNVTLNDNGAFVFGNGGPSVISGNLVLTAAGAISQTQPVSVGGTTSLDAGGSFTIALTNSNNDFTGAVSATNTGTNDISITDVNALVLGTISPGPGDLRLVSDGPITQVGPITTSGAGRVSIDAGAANDITLNHASNSIAGELRIISGNNVTLNDGGALAFGFGGASVISGNLVVTAAGPVSQTRAINVAGATSISAGANSITLTNNNNDFTGAVSLNNSGPSDVAIKDTNAIVLGASSVGSGTLTVTADGTITQTGSITQAAGAGATSVGAGANAITLTNPGNDFTGAVSLSNSGASDVSVVDANSLTLGASTVGRNLNAAAGGRLTVSGMLTTGGSTGTSIELSGAAFTNTAGAAALAPGAGSRFLVWSANTNPFGGATPDDRGALAYDFKQYDATFGVTPVAQATGNGFLYALAPTITPGLTGTVSKAYDGSTSATLAAGNYAAGGAVDGDTVTLNNPTSGAYDTRNAGTGKNVSVSGIAFVGATNGGKPVYGYQMAATTANANIGEITAAPLTVTAQTDSRGYNGTTSSAVAPVVTGTQYDALGTAATQSYDNKNVGTTHVLTASGLLMNDGNSGNNYAITYVPSAATGVITVAPLTVTAQSDSRSYNGTTSSAVAPVVTGTQYDAIGTVATQTYDNKNVGTTHVLSASGLVMNDGNSGNNYSITYAPSAASGVIIAAPLTVTAQSDSRGYNGTTSSAVAPVVTGTQYDSVGTNATQTYDNKNVGTTHVLSASGLVMNDGNSGNNYSITYAPSTATGVIIAAPLTVTAQTDSRGYNGTTSSSVLPVVTGTQYDALGTAATQSYDNKNVGTTHVLSASGLLMNDGNSGNNYAITYVPSAAAGVIIAAPLTVTAQSDSRVYNGQPVLLLRR
jgi:hypothetical protein